MRINNKIKLFIYIINMTNRITITHNNVKSIGTNLYEYQLNKQFECKKIHISTLGFFN